MDGDDELDEAAPGPATAALPCGYHGPDAACDRCPARYSTDCHGFPHPGAVPRGVRRLRHCPRCSELVTPEQWDTRPSGRGPFPKLSPWQCLQCSAEDASEPAPEGGSACAAPRAMRSRRP
jgi:hypothetical protein